MSTSAPPKKFILTQAERDAIINKAIAEGRHAPYPAWTPAPAPPPREPVRPAFPAPVGARCWCGRAAERECQSCKESFCMSHWWGRTGHSHTDRELIEREAAARQAVGR